MKSPIKAAVLISGGGTNLQAIMDCVSEKALPCVIQLVVSNNPSAYGLARAALRGIDTAVVDHREFQNRTEFDRRLIATLEAHDVEVLFLAGFMRILTDDFVEHFRGRMLNIHPSLLPDLKGLDTHRRAIDAGHEFHGASVHFVTPELDSGPVILRGKLRVGANPTVETLQQRVHQIEYRIYPQVVEWYAHRRLRLEQHTVYLDDRALPATGEELLHDAL